MIVEFEPAVFKRIVRSAGLNEAAVRELEMEFSKAGFVLDDAVLLETLLRLGADMFVVVSIFSKLGLGEDNAVRLLERRERERFGAMADIHALEVDDS